jgi:hypothetical protein
MTTDTLALRITQKAAPRFALDEVSAVVEALAGWGYSFVPPGTPGRFACETDESKYALVKSTADKTQLKVQVARDIVTAIEQSGLRFREPDTHPSGLKTTEPAHSNVQRLGPKFIAASQPIDKRPEGGKRYR